MDDQETGQRAARSTPWVGSGDWFDRLRSGIDRSVLDAERRFDRIDSGGSRDESIEPGRR